MQTGLLIQMMWQKLPRLLIIYLLSFRRVQIQSYILKFQKEPESGELKLIISKLLPTNQSLICDKGADKDTALEFSVSGKGKRFFINSIRIENN